MTDPKKRVDKRAKSPADDYPAALENATQMDGPTEIKEDAAIFRWQCGCSARPNDIQHCEPSTLLITARTTEMTPYQTKTTGALKAKKRRPLIAPHTSVTGIKW